MFKTQNTTQRVLLNPAIAKVPFRNICAITCLVDDHCIAFAHNSAEELCYSSDQMSSAENLASVTATKYYMLKVSSNVLSFLYFYCINK